MSKKDKKHNKEEQREELRVRGLFAEVKGDLLKIFGERNLPKIEELHRKVVSEYNLMLANEKEDENKDAFDLAIEEAHKRHDKEVVTTTLDGKKLTKKELKKLRKAKRDKELQAEADAEEAGAEIIKSKRGSHLIPKEKVEYPQALLSHPEVGPALKLHEKGGSDGKKGRIALRKLGFKLSEPDTWDKFLKATNKKAKK